MTTLADKLNAILPQTQCGLCGHGGCKPYAEAMANAGEAINLCPPGGVSVLQQLAELTAQDANPYKEQLQREQKPAQTVVIREDECIGCKKCIKACPVDAIVGSGKLMHTVIQHDCTGCELCIEPCPMDCIDLVALHQDPDEHINKNRERWRQLHEQREARLQRLKTAKHAKHQAKKLAQASSQQTVDARKAAIAAALERSRFK